jgi:hypothetical protein
MLFKGLCHMYLAQLQLLGLSVCAASCIEVGHSCLPMLAPKFYHVQAERLQD